MSRADKQHKLANAIREYRGLYHAQSKAWIHAPKPNALARVRYWLAELDLNVDESVKTIDSFASLDSFRQWLNEIDAAVIRP